MDQNGRAARQVTLTELEKCRYDVGFVSYSFDFGLA